jgi:drug/metabolite transporter (DMT)-like permease
MSARSASPSDPSPPVTAARARLVVGLLGLFWGLNWIAVRIALDEVRPWSLRAIGMGLGAAALFVWAVARGRSLRVAPGAARRRLAVAGVLNIAAFGVFTAFAQLAASTSRVTIVTFTMPIWSVVFARIALGERLDVWRTVAVALAAAGLAVLVAPLFAPLRAGTLAPGSLAGIGWALLAGIAWAAGTVYLKASRIDADPLAIAAWQLAAGFAAVAVGVLAFEGLPRGWPAYPGTWLAVAYHVLLGIALPYLLWFGVVGRTPAATAALGTLLVPVVAVLGAVLLLGERPGPLDTAGFALIFCAAAAVLLRPSPAAPATVPTPPRPGEIA